MSEQALNIVAALKIAISGLVQIIDDSTDPVAREIAQKALDDYVEATRYL